MEIQEGIEMETDESLRQSTSYQISYQYNSAEDGFQLINHLDGSTWILKFPRFSVSLSQQTAGVLGGEASCHGGPGTRPDADDGRGEHDAQRERADDPAAQRRRPRPHAGSPNIVAIVGRQIITPRNICKS